jgi:peroxiredoxin
MLKKSISFFLTALLVLASGISFAKGPGDKAEDFTLKSVDGKEYNLSTALTSSNYLVVMFWSTECPFVQPYTDRINSIVNKFKENGVSFWGINSNTTESTENVKSHADKKGYVFPMLKDVNNVVADMLGATKTPEVYLIDNSKTILYHGRIDDSRDADKVSSNDLKNALEEVLSGKDVSVNNTKSFGCTIKRVEN